MAPKITCNPNKLDAIVNYFRSSRVAHSIKDLEKHLPSVASINGMQVKDYLQTLSDESMINVEKIGPGNWYWSFPSEEHKQLNKTVAELRTAHAKASASVSTLRDQLAQKTAAQCEAEYSDASDKKLNDSDGSNREHLQARKLVLEAEIKATKKDLEGFRGSDPAEFEAKRMEMIKFRADAMAFTDDIEAMEDWFCKQDLRECLQVLRSTIYGDEFDPEEGSLREVS